jgi:hypothetical protein
MLLAEEGHRAVGTPLTGSSNLILEDEAKIINCADYTRAAAAETSPVPSSPPERATQ